ncbi:beta-ketoacyl synthase N-terminal-like domain-containing protein [Streptomyces sp. H39-S7]|uniref:beta-ketoacyl synthase N-terminal-like domain-containing protein n=1 Tax=Streptomyces sp. H39-S7 TaxID=3004357 RepID=UPI0022AE8217|nr:beta-ketoacyl synthase N-terminal-like domain-containing protein [Streptomyces sp. H39-S7]MCZ4123128.1 beta-ketoacyl synthase N-terminal-like domain-containing protein [Streptomyces sp. H39-S7]
MSTVVTGAGLAMPGVGAPHDLLEARPEGAAAVDPAARLGKKGLRYKDRATQLALCCADEALRDAGLLGPDGLTVPGESIAVLVASNYGNVDTVCGVVDTIAEDGAASGISPMDTPNASSNVVASTLAIKYGLRGPNLMLCNGPTTGLDAVRWADALIASGRADRALVLGVEPDNAVVRKLVGTDRVIDGAAAVVLEHPDHARERGARPRAEIGAVIRAAGVRECLDLLDGTAPHPPALWFSPGDEPRHEPDGPLPRTPRHDLSGVWGEASAALGVLQCAGAVGWFAAGGSGPVYALAGRDSDDATAGLVLLAPGAGR